MVTYLGEHCKVHPRAPSGSLASKDHASNRRVQVHRGPHVHQLLPHAHIHGIPLHKNCKSEDASPPASQDARQTVKGCLSGTIERYRRNAGRRLRNLQASRRSRSMATMATMATTAACTPIRPHTVHARDISVRKRGSVETHAEGLVFRCAAQQRAFARSLCDRL